MLVLSLHEVRACSVHVVFSTNSHHVQELKMYAKYVFICTHANSSGAPRQGRQISVNS